MKKVFSLAVLVICSLLLLPLTALKQQNKAVSAISPKVTETAENETFRIYNTKTQETEKMDVKDYLFGVLAAEMPANYNAEALKAQAVAAYTFALYRKNENQNKTYDLTDNYLTDQSFITKAEARSRWGSKAEEYTEKFENVLKETENYAITYNNEPILAVYHAISYGKTEDAENVWGKEYPYLKSAASYGDKLCDGYITTLSVNEEKFKEILESQVSLNGEPQNYIGKTDRTNAGTVKTLEICNTEIRGSKLRELFSLRSSNFQIEYKDGNFNFTVYGYGHAVGLSQNGAEYMANEGSDFKQILNHYYKNCKIEKIN